MLLAKSYNFLTVEEHLELLFPHLWVVARLFYLRELALVLSEFESLDVVLENDFELLEHALPRLLRRLVRQVALA